MPAETGYGASPKRSRARKRTKDLRGSPVNTSRQPQPRVSLRDQISSLKRQRNKIQDRMKQNRRRIRSLMEGR